MNIDFLSGEEQLAINLKSLYTSYGFSEYRLPAFEDYSFYAENRGFLTVGDVVTCNAGGRVTALRPDVTLSVVKNVGKDTGTKKLFYHEKVYRKKAFGGEFQELAQVGVEVIGDIDEVAEAEVCALIVKTLSAVSGNYALEIAHTGIVLKTLSAMKLSGKDGEFALSCLTGKNAHDFSLFAKEKGLDKRLSNAFLTLINLPPEPAAAIAELRESAAYSGVNLEISELERALKACGGNVCVNFSACKETAYYNGVVFKGYISGAPKAVLSGGRYDKLLGNMGKRFKALGFALYLGELASCLGGAAKGADTVVIYGDGTAKNALAIADGLRARGKKVLLGREVPADFCGEIVYAEVKND